MTADDYVTTDFAISRTASINKRVTGLSVRLFSVTMPTGPRWVPSSTGRILIEGCPRPNLTSDRGCIVRKCPVAKRALFMGIELLTTADAGRDNPHARNVSAVSAPATVSRG